MASNGNGDYIVEADRLHYYPKCGDFDANTLVVEFEKDGVVIATFLSPISIRVDNLPENK